MYSKGLKHLLCLAVGLAVSLSCLGQNELMETRVSATLESLLILNIDPDINVEFGVEKVGDNLYQVTKQPDDVQFSIESTGNWTLGISSADGYFTCVDDSSSKIPVDFIGYYIENKGSNWDNGLFSNIANRTKDTVLSLTPTKTTILVNGSRNNIGGSSQNSFVLRWELNIDDNIINMEKFSKMDIREGYYRANFYLTLSETNSITND